MIIRTDKFYELKNAYDWMMDFNKPETYMLELKDKNLPFMVFKSKHVTIGDCDFELTRQLRWVVKKISERLDKVGNRKELYLSKGYDCYHENTEFLTENGWKKYDQIIENETIATVNPLTKEIEFQIPFDRVKKSYSGKMYEFIGNYTRMCVTPNHRMFVSNCHRKPTNNYSTKYDEKNSNWQFVKLCDLLNKNRSCFHILNSVINNKIDFKIEDDFLNILGFFISEGNFAKFKNGIPKTIRICQTNKGKTDFYKIMDSLGAKYNFRKYSYTRKNRPDLIETVWISYNHELVQKIFSECGNKKTKRLPNWIFQLSVRQIDILLNSLLLGDGTNKNNFVDVYYTSLKLLADDVQTLGILGGREVNLNGPYTSISNYNGLLLTTYQVTITKKLGKPNSIILNPKLKKQKRLNRKNFGSRGGNEIDYNGNIVCFSVPNELLLTRYKGKIAVQGNTKFASHFLRLLMEGMELLETGDLKFPLKDREMLLEVKEGKWKLNDVLKLGEEIEKWVPKLSEKSPLPAHPQFDKVNTLVINMLKKHFNYNV
jgi:hypothetical protein